MLKSFGNNKNLDWVYQDFYTMKIEAENSGPSQLLGLREFRFTEVTVLRGSTVHKY